MSRGFATVLGLCFVALGVVKWLFSLERFSAFDIGTGLLFFVAGAACLKR